MVKSHQKTSKIRRWHVNLPLLCVVTLISVAYPVGVSSIYFHPNSYLHEHHKEVLNFQCIIHDAASRGKLRGQFQTLMPDTRPVNFAKSKFALRYRQLRSFPNDTGAEHTELGTHNNVRLVNVLLSVDEDFLNLP